MKSEKIIRLKIDELENLKYEDGADFRDIESQIEILEWVLGDGV